LPCVHQDDYSLLSFDFGLLKKRLLVLLLKPVFNNRTIVRFQLDRLLKRFNQVLKIIKSVEPTDLLQCALHFLLTVKVDTAHKLLVDRALRVLDTP